MAWLVGPAFAVAAAVVVARLARLIWPEQPEISRLAIPVLAGMTVLVTFFSTTMFDAMLTLAAVLGIGTLWRIGQGDVRPRRFVWLGLVLAFGVYAKGPVILVHLLPALVTMRVWAPVPPRLTRMAAGLVLSLLVCLALVGLWLGPALWYGTPEYRVELLWTQSAGRVAGGLAHDRPFWFLFALLPVLLFPWGWTPALWRGLWGLRGDRGIRLLTIWAVGGLILFSFISGKQAHYLLPELAAFSLLVARVLPMLAPTYRAIASAGGLALLGGLGLAAATGAIAVPEAAMASPGWALALFGGLCLVTALAGWRLPSPYGQMVMGGGTALWLHILIVTTGLYGAYGGDRIATILGDLKPASIAVTGMTYNAEFNFAARLTEPVATPANRAELAIWAKAHPAGLILGPIGRLKLNAPPETEARYNRIHYGFWPANVVTSRGSVPLG